MKGMVMKRRGNWNKGVLGGLGRIIDYPGSWNPVRTDRQKEGFIYFVTTAIWLIEILIIT